MKKVTLVLAALALTAGGSVALADNSGHSSVNTLKSEQWGHRHHISGSSAAIRDEGRRAWDRDAGRYAYDRAAGRYAYDRDAGRYAYDRDAGLSRGSDGRCACTVPLGDTRMTAPPRIRPRGLTPTMIEGTSMARTIAMATPYYYPGPYAYGYSTGPYPYGWNYAYGPIAPVGPWA